MDRHRTALVFFTVAVAAVILVASATTLERLKTHRANADRPSDTIGLAKPHRQPAEPMQKNQ